MSEGKVERKDCVEHLSCELNEDELAKYSQEMAELNQRKVEVEAEKKEAMKDYGAKLQHLKSGVNVLGRKIITRKEARDVNCFWEFDYASGEKTLIRTDTGETVKKETIFAIERQRYIEFVEKDNKDGEMAQAVKKAEEKKPVKKKSKCPHCGAKEGKEHFSACPNAEVAEEVPGDASVAAEDKSCPDCGAPEGETHSDGCPAVAEEEVAQEPESTDGSPEEEQAPDQAGEEPEEMTEPSPDDMPEGEDCFGTFDSNDAECANCDRKDDCYLETSKTDEAPPEGEPEVEAPASEEATEKSDKLPFYTCKKCKEGFDEYVNKGEGVWECPHCKAADWM